jgi:hypothetical protein
MYSHQFDPKPKNPLRHDPRNRTPCIQAHLYPIEGAAWYLQDLHPAGTLMFPPSLFTRPMSLLNGPPGSIRRPTLTPSPKSKGPGRSSSGIVGLVTLNGDRLAAVYGSREKRV